MRLSVALLSVAAFAIASPTLAGGRIGTLEPGTFTCELPGDAAGPAGREQPDENFATLPASRYQNAEGNGTYLLTGNRLEMTSGPKQGSAYLVESSALLKKLGPSDRPTRLRCVRR